MSTIATNLDLARVGLDKIVQNTVRTPLGPKLWAQMGFKDVNTTQQYVRISQKTGLGIMPAINEGDPHTEVDFAMPYRKDYYWQLYAIKYSLSNEKAASDQYGEVSVPSIGKMLQNSLDQTQNTLAASVFNNGNSTATAYVGADGVALFSASHPLETGTSSNLTNADLSQTTLGDAIQLLMLAKAHKGEPFMAAGPYKLIINPANTIAAKTIMESQLIAGSPNNDKNIAGGMVQQLINNPYITDSDSWFLGDVAANDGGLHRLVFAGNEAVSVWEDKDKRQVHHGVVLKLAFGHNHWRGWYGSYGA